MSDDWDDYADDWDGDARVQHYAELAFGFLTQRIDLNSPEWRARRVLDFGCGTGLLAEKLAPLVGTVIAVDRSAKMISVLEAKHLPRVTAICADLDDPQVRDAADWLRDFDLIVASSVMSFVPDYDAMAALLTTTLAPGGTFVQWDWRASDDAPNGLTPAQIDAALSRAGLRNIDVTQAFSVDTGENTLDVLSGMGTA